MIAIILGLSVLFGTGVAALQPAGLGLRSMAVWSGPHTPRPRPAVTQALPNAQGRPSRFTVAITYRDPVTSPLLRLLLGSTFTSTSEATVLGQ